MTPDAFASAVVGVVKSTMAPLLERLAGVEAHIKILGDVRDRMIGLEVKSAIPVVLPPAPEPVDLAPILLRLHALEEKSAALETKAAIVGPPGPAGPPGLNGKDGADGKDGRHGLDGIPGARGETGLSGKDGAAGLNGKDGLPGKDGSDGVTLDDLAVEQQDERTLVVKATVGAKVKEIGSVTFPVNIYRGVYQQGKSYEPGDLITWDGSLWHCGKQTTDKPIDGGKVWTLAAKRGRDAARL